MISKKKLSQYDQRFKINATLSKSCPIGDRVLVRERGGGPFWIELSFFGIFDMYRLSFQKNALKKFSAKFARYDGLVFL